MKKELIQKLNKIQKDLKAFKENIDGLGTVLINPNFIMQEVSGICNLWIDEIYPDLKRVLGAENQIANNYHAKFEKLLNLSGKRNKRESYENNLKGLLKEFHKDLIIPVTFSIKEEHEVDDIEDLLKDLEYPDQKKYLKEAIDCARANCFRGCIVLGWSAAMHHMHSKIEELGFDVFNGEMENLKQKNSGRFKGFKGFASIESINDIRETPDRKILVVLDGMKLMDSNERVRLEHCLDMRIHASHPGDAPITFPNLFSFYSDLTEIIFKNPKFKI